MKNAKESYENSVSRAESAKTFKPSKFQQAIFDFITHGEGSAIVMAVAGSGKTTTIVEAMKRIPISESILVQAFNKSIQVELQSRIPAHAKAQTTHSLGMAAVRNHLGRNIRIDADKTKMIIEEMRADWPEAVYKVLRYKLRKIVSLAKGHGLAPKASQLASILPDTDEGWGYLVEHFNVLGDGELLAQLMAAGIQTDEKEFLIANAREVLDRSLRDESIIDFDDMIYLPVIHQWALPKYDWIFVDEAQDISQVQLAMIKLAMPKHGRVIAVGDPHQAIYGFRGADSQALANIQAAFKAVVLPLSISYRCPKSVVREAQNYVSHIEASETAPEGEIRDIDQMKLTDFRPGDMVLCRFKAKIIKLAYRLLGARVACKVIGRDIGESIISMIENLRANDVSDLRDKLDQWHHKECKKLLKKDPDADLSEVDEKRDMIEAILEFSTARSIRQVIGEIENLFGEDSADVVRLSTIHKAKGLESKRVYWLEPSYSFKRKLKEWEEQQETNLKYVCVTRSQGFLGFVDFNDIR